jgi:hypothetical protein
VRNTKAAALQSFVVTRHCLQVRSSSYGTLYKHSGSSFGENKSVLLAGVAAVKIIFLSGQFSSVAIVSDPSRFLCTSQV